MIWALPQDTEAEVCVVGGLLLDASKVAEVRDGVSVEDFFDPRCRAVYEAICKLVDGGASVDAVTIRPLLTAVENYDLAGGADWFSENILGGVPSAASVGIYTKQVRSAAMLRQAIQLCGAARERAFQPQTDTTDYLEWLEGEVYKLRRGLRGARLVHAGDAAGLVLAHAESILRDGSESGLMTGLASIDAATGGFQPGELIVLAGDTGSGKTALADTIARNTGADGKSVLLVSCEMMERERGKRLLQGQANVPGQYIRTPRRLQPAEWARLRQGQRDLEATGVYIYAGGTIRPSDVSLMARRVAVKEGRLDLVIVDYLQLLTPTGIAKGESYARTVGRMAWQLKTAAMELGIPLILLSQLNRAGLKEGKPPSKHDLKESGDVENHSSFVLLLHQPSKEGDSVWLKIDKSRDGAQTRWGKDRSDIVLRWRPETTSFFDDTPGQT